MKKLKFRLDRLIFIILILLVITSYVYREKITNLFENNNNLLAKVNGVKITLSEIREKQVSSGNPYVTFDQILNSTIQEILLMEEAKKFNATVSNEHVTNAVDDWIYNLKKTYGDQFKVLLAQQNMTEEKLREQIRDPIYKAESIENLFNMTIYKTISVSEQDVIDYYNNNKNQFFQPAQIKASHILICYNDSFMCKSNRTKQEALDFATELLSNLTKDNFAEKAIEFSDGPSASKGGALGFFSKGQMIPEFEKVAFSLNKGEISEPVLTKYGYHIILVSDKKEANTPDFDEVKNSIKQSLYETKKQKAVKTYIEMLTKKANIVYYQEKTTDNLEQCLAKSDVTYYSASWVKLNEKQASNLGPLYDKINYVECYDGETKLDICKNINAFPTWVINGQTFEKVITKDELETMIC